MKKLTLTVVAVLAIALTMSACALTGAVIEAQPLAEDQPIAAEDQTQADDQPPAAAEAQPPATKKLTHGDLVVMVEKCISLESCQKVIATIKASDVSKVKDDQLSRYFKRLNENIRRVVKKAIDNVRRTQDVLWGCHGWAPLWSSKWYNRLMAAELDADQLQIINEEATAILKSSTQEKKFWRDRKCSEKHILDMRKLMSKVCDLSAFLRERALLCEANETFANMAKSFGSLASR